MLSIESYRYICLPPLPIELKHHALGNHYFSSAPELFYDTPFLQNSGGASCVITSRKWNAPMGRALKIRVEKFRRGTFRGILEYPFSARANLILFSAGPGSDVFQRTRNPRNGRRIAMENPSISLYSLHFACIPCDFINNQSPCGC